MWGYVLKVWLAAVVGNMLLWMVYLRGAANWYGLALIMEANAAWSIPAVLLFALAVWILKKSFWSTKVKKVALSLGGLGLVTLAAIVVCDVLREYLLGLGLYGIPIVVGIWIFRWPKPAPPLLRID